MKHFFVRHEREAISSAFVRPGVKGILLELICENCGAKFDGFVGKVNSHTKQRKWRDVYKKLEKAGLPECDEVCVQKILDV